MEVPWPLRMMRWYYSHATCNRNCNRDKARLPVALCR